MYPLYKIGSSCRTEFLMKDDEFRSTEDAVIIGIAEGIDEADALKNLKRVPIPVKSNPQSGHADPPVNA